MKISSKGRATVFTLEIPHHTPNDWAVKFTGADDSDRRQIHFLFELRRWLPLLHRWTGPDRRRRDPPPRRKISLGRTHGRRPSDRPHILSGGGGVGAVGRMGRAGDSEAVDSAQGTFLQRRPAAGSSQKREARAGSAEGGQGPDAVPECRVRLLPHNHRHSRASLTSNLCR